MRIVPIVARSRQEDAFAVNLAGHAEAIHTVLSRPLPRTLCAQFFPFGVGRHTPYTSPNPAGSVIGRLQRCLSIHIAILAARVVLDEGRIAAIAVLVVFPCISGLCGPLAPGKVAAGRV